MAERYELPGGIVPLHWVPEHSRAIVRVPGIFAISTNEDPLRIAVTGDWNLRANERQYIVTAITTRAINACMSLPESRNDWIDPYDIATFGIRSKSRNSEIWPSTVYLRAFDYLDAMRHDMDGYDNFIERRKHGSGGHSHGYRIAHDITFKDLRK